MTGSCPKHMVLGPCGCGNGVADVNISGAASARGYEFAAQVKAELAARIREERDHDR